jgi:hypothetical protein
VVNAKETVEMRLDVMASGAKKDHDLNSPGTWVVVDREARIRWEDGFWDILRLEADGSMSFLQLGTEATSWDARPKRRLNAKRIEPPKPPTNGEKCRQELLEYWMKQKHQSTLDDPELHKRIGVQVNKEYDPADDPINFALREEIKPHAKSRKRSNANEEDRKCETMQKLRKAIKDCGRRAKSATIIKEAEIERQAGLKYLRELEKTGEYAGFGRRQRRSKF